MMSRDINMQLVHNGGNDEEKKNEKKRVWIKEQIVVLAIIVLLILLAIIFRNQIEERYHSLFDKFGPGSMVEKELLWQR